MDLTAEGKATLCMKPFFGASGMMLLLRVWSWYGRIGFALIGLFFYMLRLLSEPPLSMDRGDCALRGSACCMIGLCVERFEIGPMSKACGRLDEFMFRKVFLSL